MISLARKSILHEWRRFAPAIFAIAFSGILLVIQAALAVGLFATVAVYIEKSDAELWVGFPGTPSIDQGRYISSRTESFVRMHPDVDRTEPFSWAGGVWRSRPGAGDVSVVLAGIDPRPGSLTFAHAVSPDLRDKLTIPGAVLVDIADRDKLGVSIGSNAEINGKKVHVAGFTEGLRGIGSINVISSLSTARHLDPGLHHTDDVAYYLVKLRAGADPAAVKDALSPKEQNARYQAWTAKEFGDRSTNYWLFESGMGTAFGLSSLVAVIVAIVITSQTLMAAVAASIREFATLRALGAPGSHLRSVVLQQALWVGMVGLVVAGLVSALILWLAKLAYIPVSVSVPITTGCAVLVLCVAILSGFVALSQLSKADPAALLR
ncbi:ABC transporter permease [Sphingomonas koreensis]|jgi:putative ABC transport system permease protein|uniref:ABC transporter permease n=1 Tax=Sphingomonas koreensis TaxID=93064 RepID=A0A1L6JDB2_9SPHN|nr:ABC transporter permease [Sphingomonas koreensis]APR53913.1 hypothetical protein BRX40_17190 [Sphingomonas koreensis]PJI90535.1 putative ABC transport system permease protein [Sphingomonas koreensis]RSU18981.1 ABC transporter permease [Sphingomonas koreensis]RSU24056.1 ABC transporter permease [Sphingomonas koreensis]RSU26307.1 ABC transporter permease [Sphingomonas koreensis]